MFGVSLVDLPTCMHVCVIRSKDLWPMYKKGSKTRGWKGKTYA